MAADETLHVIRHIDDADQSWIEEIAGERQIRVVSVWPAGGDPLPPPATVRRAIVLGGPMSADEVEEHPVLADEHAWLRALAAAGIPVLGICLGSQLLAVALGGSVHRGEHGLESGYINIEPTGNASHPLADALPGRHFSFHTDVSVPPEGAELLAVSDRYLQAWALGSALAIQFHPEISPAGIQGLVDYEGPKLGEAGVDGDALIAAAATHESSCRVGAEQIIGRWLDQSLSARSDAR